MFLSDIMDLYPKDEKFFTPEEFLNMSVEERNNIKESKIIPPKLGDGSFGGILVKFKTSVYPFNYNNLSDIFKGQ